MESVPLPLRMFAGVEHLGANLENWTLLGPPSVGKNRRYIFEVRFGGEFQAYPIVQLGLTGFDISNRDFARVKVRSAGITPAGFSIVVETWFDTQIHGVDVSWLAIGT